jgi:hypothetical protein
MATTEGYVTVFESSDGGSGNPGNTNWQFFVDPGNAPRQQVTTKNQQLADTIRFAVETSSRVRVTYDPAAPHVMSQALIEFSYVCESHRIEPCRPPTPEPGAVCVTTRYAVCDPAHIPKRE